MRFFLTGTDTDVGKTVACAWFMLHTPARYWKPVQAGLDETDESTIRALTGAGDERFVATSYTLPEPLSPHEAAKRAGVTIDMESIKLPDGGDLVIFAIPGSVMNLEFRRGMMALPL